MPVGNHSAHGEATQGGPLKRELGERHIRLMALGACIGVGLFLGSAKAIEMAGPAIMLSYIIGGLAILVIMRALGEMAVHNPVAGSFSRYAQDYLGPLAGFLTGWNYWFLWLVTCVAEITAVAIYMGIWFPDVPRWIWALAALGSMGAVNLIAVKAFGEFEFWFALIKIIAIVVLIAVGLWMIFTGFTSTAGEVASFTNLWSHDGLFPTGMSGFLAGFQIAIFAFVGVELVGTTAAETKDPERNLPKAVNSIPIRIIIFYVLALLIVMSVTPWNKIDPNISPFVNLFSQAGVAAAAIIMNLVVLSSVMSSMNSGVFSTSRMLFGLSREAQAPPLSTILFICVWIIIMWSYINYRKQRPELHAKSIFKLPGGVFTCWVVIIFFIGMVYVLSLEADTFQALKVSPLWLIILAIGYFFTKSKKS